MKIVPILAAPVLLAGCATMSAGGSPKLAECKAEPAQELVGQTASAEVGAQALRLTHAGLLRWGTPRTPMTREFRQDRVTVYYDDDLRITSVSCG